MKKVLLSTFLVLILSGCSIDWNGEKDQKIVKLEKQVEELKKEKENDLFEKNIQCNKLENDIKSFAVNFYGEEVQIKSIFIVLKEKVVYLQFIL